MNTGCRNTLRVALAATVVCLANACATAPGTQSPSTMTAAQMEAIVASPNRTTADRENDKRRKPEQVLGFIGLRPGMVAVDVVAGGGYTTELLARAVGPTGRVFAHAQPRDPSRPVSTGARAPGAGVLDRVARLQKEQVSAAPIVLLLQPLVDPVPPEMAQGRLDLVTLMFNYHDLGALGEGRAQMNRAIFAALKPGGVYVVADHAGRAGTGISESTTLHRIEESFLRSEVEGAGFKLLAEGSFLRNPADPRDKETPDPAMPKDEFILKFVKPGTGG